MIRYRLICSVLLWASYAQAQTAPVPNQCVTTALAGGTGDAITIPRLPCVPTTTLLLLVLSNSNTTTTPTLQPVGSPALPIVSANGLALAVGELAAGFHTMMTSDGQKWYLLNALPAATAGFLTPEAYGAAGNGTSNDTAPVTSCFTASSSSFPCFIQNGKTYIVDSITVPNNVYVQGGGTLKRLPGSVNSTWLRGSCVNLHMSGITLDGNKANETVPSDNLYCLNYSGIRLNSVTSINAKGSGIAIGSLGGNGITLDTSVDQAANNYSSLSQVTANNNDQDGVIGFTAAWKLQLLDVVADSNGAYGAYFGWTGAANNVDSTLQYITVKGGDYSNNSNSGLAAQGFVSSFIGGAPAYGPGIEPVAYAMFADVRATNNGSYGIVLQARNSALSNSEAISNGTGGVLANGEFIEVSNVRSLHNSVGLDIGSGLGVHVIGGDYSANSTGINLGATSYSSVRSSTITSNTVYNVYGLGSEQSGDGFGLPGFTQTLVITGNRIGCPNNSVYGIVIQAGGLGVEVSHNYIQACATDHALIVEANSAAVHDNTVPLSGDPTYLNVSGTDFTATPNTTGTLVIPQWADTIAVPGVSNFSYIKSNEENIYGGSPYAVMITNGGSGYTTASTATWTGCTTPPTGTVMVNRNGSVTGYRFTGQSTHGSGCINPITVTFSGGSGATSVVYSEPLIGSFQKTLTLIVTGPYGGLPSTMTIPYGGPGNVGLAQTGITNAPTASTVTFHWGYNEGFYEIARAIH